jgi:hypothetical protein
VSGRPNTSDSSLTGAEVEARGGLVVAGDGIVVIESQYL